MEIALFPLNTVLFPGMRLPLNIFEERYKLMLKQCLEDGLTFGVVLIRSGEEVGGQAQPFSVGTTARITSVEATDDGRFIVEAVGDSRFRTEKLLHRYPFIRAEVSLEASVVGDNDESAAATVRSLFEDFGRAALAMTGQWVRSVAAPEGPAALADFVGARLTSDNAVRQRIIEATTVKEQLEIESEALRHEVAAVQGRLRSYQAMRWWGLGSIN
ncbi:MAG: LON peptidase substrate-binding domain-containing protein [Dehalococcoidia bacterium]